MFRDGGQHVDMPEDQWLQIKLCSNWMTSGSKLDHRKYELRNKEQSLVDKLFETPHDEGKMEFSTESTPLAFPVFVVWKNIIDEDGQPSRKGRVVVDIRGLNKVSIKDAYPLPNMSDTEVLPWISFDRNSRLASVGIWACYSSR